MKGTLKKLRKRDVAKAVLKSPGAIISRRVRTNIKSVFLKEINEGGLPMLNELVLRMAGPDTVLNMCWICALIKIAILLQFIVLLAKIEPESLLVSF